jgi:hypothetical protein
MSFLEKEWTMRIFCTAALLLGLLAAGAFSSLAPPTNGAALDPAGETDSHPPVTVEDIEILSKRVEVLSRFGRTDEAAELERTIQRLAPLAISVPERETVIPELHGGVAESAQPFGSKIAASPWGVDRVIYHGDYSYDAWLSIEHNQPYSVDYDSLGNVYAAVVLADSNIHIFQSSDNGETWVDRRTVAPGAKAFINNIQLVVSDDGDSALAYLFYLWTGDGGNLWCNVTNMDTWTQLRQYLLDSAAADTIVDFSVTRDHYWGEDYILYADYQKGQGDAIIYFTRSSDHSVTWSTPQAVQFNSEDPCLTYGGYSLGGNLYRTYTAYPSHPDSSYVRVRRSDTYGSGWDPSITVRDNTTGDLSDPQVAAAHTARDSQAVWCTYTADSCNTGNLQVWSSSSSDGGLNWNIKAGPAGQPNADEYGSSIAVLRRNAEETFYLSYVYDDTTAANTDSIRIQYTDAPNWPGHHNSVGISDSVYAPNCRPLVTFSLDVPGVAYGGAQGVNVYYDNVWFTGAEDHLVRDFRLKFDLLQSRPNPFSSQTTIQFMLPAKSDVSLRVYDVTGRLIRTLLDQEKNAGVHTAAWDGRNDIGDLVSGGVYFCRLSCGTGLKTRKLNLVR